MIDKTMPFSLKDERENEMKEILTTVYGALKEKGYNPINQLVGYIPVSYTHLTLPTIRLV